MTATGSRTTPQAEEPVLARVAAGVLGSVVVASLLDIAIAGVAHLAGVKDFKPLTPPAYLSFTIFGIVAATAGWAIIRRRAAHPAPLLRRLVPTVLLLSFVPDVAILLTGSMNATAGGVAALMVMHVAVAVVIVTTLRRTLPVT